jgi:hypothetical protein
VLEEESSVLLQSSNLIPLSSSITHILAIVNLMSLSAIVKQNLLFRQRSYCETLKKKRDVDLRALI